MYVLDTNAAYYLVNEVMTSKAQLAKLHEKAEAKQLVIGVPPITVMELSARIVEEPTWFEKVRSVARAVMDLRPCALPDPEQRMREITEDIVLARQSYEHWIVILETIARAPDAAVLQRGFDDLATATRRSANVVDLARYRSDYERQYVDDMLSVVHVVNNQYDAQVLSEKVTKLPKHEREALANFLASPEWKATFVAMLAHRGGSGVTPTDTGKLAVILGKAEYFQRGYEALILNIFCDGARPSLKKKNDYNDIHQLFYVNKFSEDILVSEDHGLLSKADDAQGKVIAYTEFLRREAS